MSTKFAFIALFGVLAAGQDLLPLQPGNVWVYRNTGTAAARDPMVLTVSDTRQAGGQIYSLFEGLRTGSAWLRSAGGRVYAWNDTSGMEELWWDFTAEVGQPYATAVPGGLGRALVGERGAVCQPPVGLFWGCLTMRYPLTFQVGLNFDTFAPDIGLVARSESTGGPSVGGYELVYARTGESMRIGVPVHGLALALDKAVYRYGDALTLLMEAQGGDLTPADTLAASITDDRGQTVWQQPDDAAREALLIRPDLQPGSYTLAVRLTRPQSALSASVAFTVTR
jgi:hypothetical protein